MSINLVLKVFSLPLIHHGIIRYSKQVLEVTDWIYCGQDQVVFIFSCGKDV